MSKPRAVTPDELRAQFLDHVRAVVNYWASLEGPHTAQDRCEGVAFSLLGIFDGASMAFPSFDLVARPHADDKAFDQKEGRNWIENGTLMNASGELHSELLRRSNDQGDTGPKMS